MTYLSLQEDLERAGVRVERFGADLIFECSDVATVALSLHPPLEVNARVMYFEKRRCNMYVVLFGNFEFWNARVKPYERIPQKPALNRIMAGVQHED